MTAAESELRRPGFRLVEYLRWWTETLAASLPDGWLRGVGLVPDRLLLEPSAAGFEAILEEGDRRRVLPAMTGSEVPLAWHVAAGQARVSLRLPVANGLLRPVDLPLAAIENLSQVLRFEMDRLTPFRAEQVYFGFRLHGRVADRLSATLWAVPRATVEAALSRATDLGFAVEEVQLADAGPLAVAGAVARGRGIGWLNGLLAALAVGLILAALALPFWRGQQRLTTLAATTVEVRPAAEQSAALARERERLTGGTERAFRGKAAAGSVAVLLEELSRRLPDDAWLGQFNVVEGRLELEGSAASTSALVPLIEASPRFGKVSFRAPVVSDPVTRREHFQLSVEVRRP